MQKKHSLAFFISATLLIVAGTLSTGLISQAQAKFVAPDGGCWCTTYVANHYHLPPTYPNANKWPGWLRGLGWKKDRTPHVGDIEVLQPKTDGASELFGHVGVIHTAGGADNQQWKITLRGAYQQIYPQFRDANCRNVSDWTSTLSIGRQSGVSYFYKLGVSRQ
jgi:hypothetical protein